MASVASPELAPGDLLASIKALSDQQLRAKLVSRGENVCPIGPSVRPLYEKKLLRYMTGGGVEQTDDKSGLASSTVSVSELPKAVDSSSVQDLPAGSVFFSIAIPSDSKSQLAGIYQINFFNEPFDSN